MSQDLINRYQPGGDIYQSIAAKYGQQTADACASAALSGDETQVNAALTSGAFGPPLDSSTASIFLNQITTNPLGAPLEGLNNVLSNTVKSLLDNKYVLVIGGLVVFITLFDGLTIIKNQLNKATK